MAGDIGGSGTNAAEQPGDAEHIAREASAAGRDIMDRQRAAVASELDSIVTALRKTAGALHDEHQDSIARYAQHAADGLADLSHTLREQDLSAVAHRVGDYAKRQPGMFLGAAVASGFVVSRLLMSGRSTSPAAEHPREAPMHHATRGEEPSPAHPGGPDQPSSEHMS